MKTCIFSLVALAFSASIIPAAAQGTASTQCPLPSYAASCSYFNFPPPDGAPSNPPVGTLCCNPGGVPDFMACNAPRLGCLTPNTAGEICISCLTHKAGQPIDLATGNTYISQQDISIPGLGGGLQLTRTWNSMFPAMQNSYPSMFGSNWRSNYEERLIFNSPDLFLKYARGDGSVWSFGAVSLGPNTYKTAAPANDTTTIVNGSPNLTLTSKSGEKRLFAATTGALVSIIDRNGNTTQLTYDSQNRLITVTDPASRHLNFTYTGNSTLVSTVTSDAGITYSYSYDNQGRLTKVTKPDNTTVTFVYDSNNMITTVKDSDGKVLESHTYDALGRGLTSSRANGVDSVTVTYPH